MIHNINKFIEHHKPNLSKLYNYIPHNEYLKIISSIIKKYITKKLSYIHIHKFISKKMAFLDISNFLPTQITDLLERKHKRTKNKIIAISVKVTFILIALITLLTGLDLIKTTIISGFDITSLNNFFVSPIRSFFMSYLVAEITLA